MNTAQDVTHLFNLSNLSVGEKSAWFPEIVSWNTTQRCNLQCGHCYLAAGPGGPSELSFDEGCQVIDQLAAAGTRLLILTGGEPLMRRDMVELVRRASGKGITAVLGTNGMLLTRRTVRQLREAGLAGAGISLDSVDPNEHDRFRGVPGAWEGAVRGIRLCRAEGLPVLLQMTALPWNYTEIPQMVALARREGVAGFTLYFLVCTGRGEQLSDISPGQYEEALSFLIDAQRAYPDMMVRARCAPQIGRLASEAGSALVGSVGCPAARQYCRITPEGSVTPCPYLPLSGGDLRQESFQTIWEGAALFRILREGAFRGKCGECGFKELCGGCRARAYALGGDALGEDPWCAYQPGWPFQVNTQQPVTWTVDAETRLNRIPGFIRSKVRTAVEHQVQAEGKREVTGDDLRATLQDMGRRMGLTRGETNSLS